MFDAIFWDNDGVLVETEHLYFEATRRTLAPVGVDLTEALYHELFLAQDRGAWHLAEAAGVAPAHVARMRSARDALYGELLGEGSRAMPGVAAALERLAPRHRMAIVTSSRRAHFEIIHRTTGFPRFFEFVLAREDYERSKPHPEPYLTALARARLDATRCLVVEDSERGLRAAKAAGLTCYVIPNRLTRAGDFSTADRVLDTIDDLVRALDPGREDQGTA